MFTPKLAERVLGPAGSLPKGVRGDRASSQICSLHGVRADALQLDSGDRTRTMEDFGGQSLALFTLPDVVTPGHPPFPF